MKLKTSHYIFISLAITAILFPIAVNSLRSMTLDTSIDQIMGTDSRTKDTYEKFNKAFQDNTALIAIAKIDSIFSDSGAITVYELSNTLQSIPGLKDIKSLTHSARPVKGKLSLDFREMVTFKSFVDLKPKTPEEWSKIKKFTTEYPMTRDILVSADGKYALIIAVLESDIVTMDQKKELLKLTEDKIKPFIDKGISINLLSEPFLAAEFNNLVNDFLFKFISISLSLLTLTIYITFRSFRILILMLSYQVAGFLIFPPVFHMNVTNINVFTFIIIPLVSALHLTFLTHFFSVFQYEIKRDEHLKPALKRTLAIVLKPSIIALITSGIGLGALIISDIPVLKTVGIVGLEALLGVFIITFVPALILALGKTEDIPLVDDDQNEPTPILPFINKYKYILMTLSIIFGILVISFISKLNTDVRIKEFLDNQSKTRASLNLLDEHFGGINILQLEVRTDKPDGIQNYEVIKYLHDLRLKAMDLDGVLNAYTYSQFYTTLHQLFLGDNLSTGNVLPEETAASMYTRIINSISFPFQDVLQTEDRKSTVFFLRTRDLPTKEFLNVIDKFSTLAKENTPEGVDVRVQDGVHTILRSNKQIVETQIHSLGTSLFCIFICLLLMWRSVRLAATALLCNLIPLLCIGGIMLILNIPINSVTVMAGSIIIGISVDDSIHFLSYYKSLREKMEIREAVSMALNRKLKPMICTSIILIICLMMLLLAPFTPIKDFGFIGGISLIGGLFSSCILLPGLLMLKNNKKID